MVFPPFITTHSLGVEVQTDGDVLLRQEGVGEVFQEVLWQRGDEVFQKVLQQRGL